MGYAVSKAESDVKEFGWHVIMVPEDSEGPSFAYSIGFRKTFDHPEVIMLGLDINIMHGMINIIGNRIKAGTRFLPGQRYQDIFSDYDCLFVEVQKKYLEEYFGQAIRFYKDQNFQAMQCLWPDRQGLFPAEPNFPESLRAKQTLTISSRDKP